MVNPSFSFVPSIRQPDSLCGPISSQPGPAGLRVQNDVSRAVVGQTEGLAAPSQQIEFRIRMMDDRDRQIMWEDTIEPTVEETDMVAGHDDAAENLPVWRGEGPEEMKQEGSSQSKRGFDLPADAARPLRVSFSFRAPVTDPSTWTGIARTTARAAIAWRQRAPASP